MILLKICFPSIYFQLKKSSKKSFQVSNEAILNCKTANINPATLFFSLKILMISLCIFRHSGTSLKLFALLWYKDFPSWKMKRWECGKISQHIISFPRLWCSVRSVIWLTLWYFPGILYNFLIYLQSLYVKFRFVLLKLTRTCIKSTTNIYLSILAFTDTSFLLFIYVFSKQYHYDVHQAQYEIYWRTFALIQWLYTAFCKLHHVALKIESFSNLLSFLLQYTLQFIWLWAWLSIAMMLWANPLG